MKKCRLIDVTCMLNAKNYREPRKVHFTLFGLQNEQNYVTGLSIPGNHVAPVFGTVIVLADIYFKKPSAVQIVLRTVFNMNVPFIVHASYPLPIPLQITALASGDAHVPSQALKRLLKQLCFLKGRTGNVMLAQTYWP